MKLYIETSVPNMLLHDDAPEKTQVTELFLRWLRLSAHEPFVSPVMLREIAQARSPRRELLAQAVLELRATMLAVAPEAEMLAQQYAVARVVPARFQDDLLHVAVAVCHRLDMIVSWNMKHLANPTKVSQMRPVPARGLDVHFPFQGK